MPGLVDYLGRPVESSKLTEEVAAPSLGGVRTTWHSSVADALTPVRLAQILAAVDQENSINDYLTLAEEMEMRDQHYASVLSTRKNAVSGLEITVDAATDDPQHVEERDFVKSIVDAAAFRSLVRTSLDALGKSFSVNEIMWDRDGRRWSESRDEFVAAWIPKKYIWRDGRFFMFDLETKTELRMVDQADVSRGIALEGYKFVQHYPNIKTGIPIHGGLARVAVVAYMCKGYTIKDWMAFAEVFGMPLRIGKYPKNADDRQKANLLRAVTNIGTDAAAIIPEDMIIEFIQGLKTSTGGEKLFEGLANWLDKQTSKGVLGQVASTEGTPGRLGGDLAQDSVRDDIRIEDSKELFATLQRDIVSPVIDLNFGAREEALYPKLRIVVDEPEDLKVLSDAIVPLIDRGLKVQASIMLDKFGIAEAEEGAELLQPKSSSAPKPPEPDDGEPSPGAGDDVDEEEAEIQLQRRKAAVAITHKIWKGTTLTNDERLFIVSTMVASPKDVTGDNIDQLTDVELEGWHKMMDPILQPVIDLANKSMTYGEFLDGLDNALAKMDSTKLAERLGVSTFKARGVGDGTDEP